MKREKKKKIENKKSASIGFWKKEKCYMSGVINLGSLTKYKGNIVIFLRKNPYKDRDDNRPDFIAFIQSRDTLDVEPLPIHDFTDDWCKRISEKALESIKDYYGLYTRDQVQYAINCAAEDGARGYGYGDNIVEDYL